MNALHSERVAIEQQRDFTNITIRAARGWSLLFIAFWLVMWTTMPFKLVIASVRSLAHPHSVHLFELLWSVGWFLGICFAVSSIVWGLGGRDFLSLSSTELRLSSTVFGFAIRRKIVPTSDVRNLRFMPSYRKGRGSTPSKLAFEDAHGTVKFASGLEDSEAFAVIEAMLAAYPFPKRDRALDYVDLSH